MESMFKKMVECTWTFPQPWKIERLFTIDSRLKEKNIKADPKMNQTIVMSFFIYVYKYSTKRVTHTYIYIIKKKKPREFWAKR